MENGPFEDVLPMKYVDIGIFHCYGSLPKGKTPNLRRYDWKTKGIRKQPKAFRLQFGHEGVG